VKIVSQSSCKRVHQQRKKETVKRAIINTERGKEEVVAGRYQTKKLYLEDDLWMTPDKSRRDRDCIMHPRAQLYGGVEPNKIIIRRKVTGPGVGRRHLHPFVRNVDLSAGSTRLGLNRGHYALSMAPANS